jgi:hypothetical protein
MPAHELNRRSFISLCGNAAAGSFILNPADLFADNYQDPFKLLRSRWIIYENGSYDLISKEIILKNCRPAINGQTVMSRNVFLGDSPKGIRIVYELSGGFLMLDLQTNEDSLSIGTEFSGLSQAPRWFYPISQAKVFGVDSFFRQGLGTGGPSGIYNISKELPTNKDQRGLWQNWTLDSYLSFAFMGKNETIAVGTLDNKDFLQRSTIYNQTHRTRLQDKEEYEENIFFEAAMQLDQSKIKNEYIKLPNLHFFTGNKPYETLREMSVRTANRSEARKNSLTSYHWISKSSDHGIYSFEKLKKQIDFLADKNPFLPVQTIVINKGYCVAGDWLEPDENWPGGLENAAREIFKHGYRAGIWIAPFIVSNKSKLIKKHPDWIIKNSEGYYKLEMANKNETFYTIDPSNNNVRKYLRTVFQSLRKMGFIFYEMDYLEWGLKDSQTVKMDSQEKSSVQILREVLDIIRHEIGYGSLVVANNTAFQPVIGFADIVKTSSPCDAGWNDAGVKNMIRETYHTQHFNNLLWQNNPGEINIIDNRIFSEDERISLALWKAFLGGAVCTSDDFTRMTSEQLEFFKFLEPARLIQNIRFPYWPSTSEIKVAVKYYNSYNSWGILFFNDKEISVSESYPVSELTEYESLYVFNWKPGFIIPFGSMRSIIIDLMPHQSRLLWLSQNNDPPPKNLTLGGKISDQV